MFEIANPSSQGFAVASRKSVAAAHGAPAAGRGKWGPLAYARGFLWAFLFSAANYANADVLIVDAANQYFDGTPMTDRNAVRMLYDNTTGGAITLKFQLDFTGITPGWGGWVPTDSTNPWYGLPDRYVVIQDGVRYMFGTVWEQGNWFGPKVTYDLTPDIEEDFDESLGEYPNFVIPPGLLWETFSYILGAEFFHSPAHTVVSEDGALSDYYDYDPKPQTVPEPCTLVILAAGAALVGAKTRNSRQGRQTRSTPSTGSGPRATPRGKLEIRTSDFGFPVFGLRIFPRRGSRCRS